MLALFRQPKWIALSVLVAVVAALFLSLGFWQLDRRSERILDNEVRSSRFDAPVVDLEAALSAIGSDVSSLEYRQVTVTGTFRPESEILIRSRVFRGTAGFGVITPLEIDSGVTVLVDRGWVPLEYDTAPIPAPPLERVGVAAMVRLSLAASSIGPVDEANAATFSRVDLSLLANRFPGLAPVWLQVVSDARPGSLPVPAGLPVFDSEGPHMSYAVQWFSFAIISLVGFYFLARKSARR